MEQGTRLGQGSGESTQWKSTDYIEGTEEKCLQGSPFLPIIKSPWRLQRKGWQKDPDEKKSLNEGGCTRIVAIPKSMTGLGGLSLRWQLPLETQMHWLHFKSSVGVAAATPMR